MISHELFHTRLAAGESLGFPYSSALKAGFVSVRRHVDAIVLAWEEYALRDARKLRDERREFSSTGEAVSWLATQGLDAARFEP